MERSSFNLHQTMETITKAIEAVVCHMLFDFALHGIIFSIFLFVLGAHLLTRKHPYSASIFRVAKRICIFCSLLTVPGLLSLIVQHHLPDAGVFSFNSIGLLCFWSLISVHLVFEEINNNLVKKSVKEGNDKND